MNKKKGIVFWIEGFSGSGKTSISKCIQKDLSIETYQNNQIFFVHQIIPVFFHCHLTAKLYQVVTKNL